MAIKFYIYLDLGSGDQLITPQDLDIRLTLKRGVLNDYITRKELNGSFKLEGDDFDDAKVYFIDNGNYESVIKVYENGDSGTGTLKFEGWARVNATWDYRRSVVTFDSFRTNDIYTELISKLENEFIGESLVGFGTYNELHAQGQNINANQLFLYTWNGTNFVLSGSPATSKANIGRCAACEEGGEVVFLDSANTTLESYTVTAGSWVQQRSLLVPFQYEEIDLVGLGSNQVAVIGSDGTYDVYQFSGATTFTLISSTNIGDIKFPSLALAGANTVIVDEQTNTLRVVGAENSLSVGNVSKPSICTLDTGNNRLAYIDASQQILKAYSFSGSTWSQVGTGLQLNGLFAPVITQYSTNNIVLHDTIKGVLEFYSFSGAAWAQVGNTTNLSGGYVSAVGETGGDIFIAISDTFPFNGSIMQPYYGLVNSLLFQNNIWGTSSPNYELQTTGNGATINVNDLVFGTMNDIADNVEDSGNFNRYRHKLSEVFTWYELFQNYWYVNSSNKIVFTQPNLFSSTGTDIDISSLQLSVELDQRTYTDGFLIDQEELVFNNAENQEFFGNFIDYQRNTPIIEKKAWNFTTDFQLLIDIYTGQIISDISSSGLLIYLRDSGLPGNMAASGTGIISGLDTKNYLLSQSQIYNDYLLDYRYKDQGTILINGSSSPVQDTCREIIEYPTVTASEEQLGLIEFPDDMASLIWGGGIPNSFIMELSIDLETRQYTILSRLLDL